MRMGNKGPHDRPWIWLMAVIVICLAPVMDPIAADITVTAQTDRARFYRTDSRRNVDSTAAYAPQASPESSANSNTRPG